MNKSIQELVNAIRDYILWESPDHYTPEEAERVAREHADRIDDEM